MAAAAAMLHSDHVNLLVFRYLQEVGFESAANAFHRDWHRRADCHDPENLPFAHEVRRNELVTIIQTGLYHDSLQSRVRKNGERKFRWAGIDAREPVDRSERPVENGGAAGTTRKPRPAKPRPQQDFPTPAPKRRRKSEGSEAQVNGEAMDVDPASPAVTAEGEGEGEGASPTVPSEPEYEVMERYDSMDVATQTEVKTGPKTSTMYWKVDKPGASIFHNIWNPHPDPKNANTLLAVGQSLCRFYQVPETMDDTKQITHIDEPSLSSDDCVTASAWRPDGTGASCAIDGIRKTSENTNMASHILVEHTRESGSVPLQLGPPLLEPAGIVLALKYSANSEFLLVARTNMRRSLVQIWKTPRLGSDAPRTTREPIAWRIFDVELLDVEWTDEDRFVVCGANSLSACYQVDTEQPSEAGMITANTVAMRGLISHNSSVLPCTWNWDRVRFDSRHRVAAFASIDEKKMIVTPRLENSDNTSGADDEVSLPTELTALAFRPWERTTDSAVAAADLETPSLLAVGYGDGTCTVYNVRRTDAGAKCAESMTVALNDGPALALAWSPDGEYLAVGNEDLVQIWSAASLKQKNGVRHAPEALVIWRPASEFNGAVNGTHHPEKSLAEPSLSWSADGESLAFAADKQIAVIRFRPSLASKSQDVDMNGTMSP